MGLLDAMFGGGSPLQMNPNAAVKPFSQRLTSGMGQQGGLLQHMGMGQFGNQPMEGGFGRKGGLLEMLSNSASGDPWSNMRQEGQQPQQQGGLIQILTDLLQKQGGRG